MKNNKNIAMNYNSFIKYAKTLYIEKRLKEKFTCDNVYLKNLYYRIFRKYYQLNLENVYDYSEKISNNENFCRYVTIKQLVSKDNKMITHKAIIFFSDFDINRLSYSKHLLIDGTFIFPKGFIQTIIIMYYDEIIDKMIPGVFMVINNKTEAGYLDLFNYIKQYIEKILKNRFEKYKFKTFTTDFEIGLYEAFNNTFNTNNTIKHIGCYFHFLQNIRKYFQKKGLTKKIYESVYNNIMNTCRNLPFKNFKKESIIKIIENNYQIILKKKDSKLSKEAKEIILEDFNTYFKGQWLDYFTKGVLVLNHINIKYRSNNCLENFNKQLKRNFLKKKDINLINYVDIIIEEVIKHEEYIIEETKRPLNKMSKKSLFKIGENDIVANIDKIVDQISGEILNYQYENNEDNNHTFSESNFENDRISDKDDNNMNQFDNENRLINELYVNLEAMEDVLYHSLIGFNNMGTSCYLNSGLQIIIHCYRFMIDLLIDINNNISRKFVNNDSISYKFLQLLKHISKKFLEEIQIYTIKDLYSFLGINKNFVVKEKTVNITIEPLEYFKEFSKKHPIYAKGQHDAVEFIRVFLNDISKENILNKVIAPYKELNFNGKSKKEASIEFHTYFISRENSVVIKNFYFQIINTFVCTCGYKSYSFEKFLDLPILIPGNERNYNLTDLLKNSFSNSLTNWTIKCENCNEINLNHIKIPKIDMIGRYLLISIQRLNRILNTKNKAFITFNQFLNIREFMDIDSKEASINFTLIGGIYHYGTIAYGHYYSVIKLNDIWVEFNDSSIKKLKKMEFNSNSVCALIYEKI